MILLPGYTWDCRRLQIPGIAAIEVGMAAILVAVLILYPGLGWQVHQVDATAQVIVGTEDRLGLDVQTAHIVGRLVFRRDIAVVIAVVVGAATQRIAIVGVMGR